MSEKIDVNKANESRRCVICNFPKVNFRFQVPEEKCIIGSSGTPRLFVTFKQIKKHTCKLYNFYPYL